MFLWLLQVDSLRLFPRLKDYSSFVQYLLVVALYCCLIVELSLLIDDRKGQ